MPTYRYTGDNSFSHEGAELSAGDEIELSEYAYRLHAAYFEPVDGDADDSDAEDPDPLGTDADVADAPFNPATKTNSDIETDLGENDYSEAELQALLAAETSGKDRDGAKEAINDHLADEE